MAQTEAADWELVAEHTAWQPRDSSGEVVFNGRMWLLGGWFNSLIVGPRDVWESSDGVTWTETAHEAAWTHGDLPTTLVFKDRMWFMGGWYAGRLPEGGPTSSVWSSPNGKDWDCVTQQAAWSPRLGAAGVVFKDKMWVLGGSESYFFGDAGDLRNDVWCSEDGKDWHCALEHAPWAPRAYHCAAVFQDKIWVFGGGNYLPEYLGLNDVWCSEDGVDWTQVTEAAPWHSRIWFSAVVYRDCLWILGGWSNNPSQNWNDVWYTADGETWKRLETPTIWKERHEHSTYVFQDSIWVVAGNPWPCVNEVWRLKLPKGWRP